MAQHDAPAEGLTHIKSIGVIGAVQMGSGIAHVCALAGYDVTLSDVSADQAARAIDVLTRNLDRQVQRGQISEADKTAALALIRPGTSLYMFADRHLLIQAANEPEEDQRQILPSPCPP